MLLVVIGLIVAERWSRRSQRVFQTTQRHRPGHRAPLSRFGSVVAFTACMIPLTLGFLPTSTATCADRTATTPNSASN
jgi:iron(III) transport system permease protein